MQWRLFADCVNNVGASLLLSYCTPLESVHWCSCLSRVVMCAGYIADLLSPLFPDAFLLLACIGSLSRAITGDWTGLNCSFWAGRPPVLRLDLAWPCRPALLREHRQEDASSESHCPAGVAGGATRAALTQHFALTGNAADIAAKEGSQVSFRACCILHCNSIGLSKAYYAAHVLQASQRLRSLAGDSHHSHWHGDGHACPQSCRRCFLAIILATSVSLDYVI